MSRRVSSTARRTPRPAAGRWLWLLAALILMLVLQSCAAPAPNGSTGEVPAEAPAAEEPVEEPAGESDRPTPQVVTPQVVTPQVVTPQVVTPQAGLPDPQEQGGSPLSGTPRPAPTVAAEEEQEPAPPQAGPVVEGRLVELEWPDRMRIGESDVIRLALVPTRAGYEARAEFPDHSLQTEEIPVPRPNGYELYAVARLDGVSFDITPSGDQQRFLTVGEEVAWRWTLAPRQPGRQRLSIQLHLLWKPAPGAAGTLRESQAFSRGLDVQVLSFLGMSQAQAASTGFVGLLAGGILLLVSVFSRRLPARPLPAGPNAASRGDAIQPAAPSPRLAIELPTGLSLADAERRLLQALFSAYERLVIENEFLSGYSGARTFLVRPIRPDGVADAQTIVKLGPRAAIQREFDNYEAFVKDRLPPMTARIQRPPVSAEAEGKQAGALAGEKAAVQYTFIAEPGRAPVSLRRALLAHPDPALLTRLFETFGPHWWMQRRPYTFRMEQEYDSLLPPHYVLEPLWDERPRGDLQAVRAAASPDELNLTAGQLVLVHPFQQADLRADGRSLTLRGVPVQGQPALRLRWLSPDPPRRGGPTLARVTAVRYGLLEDLSAGFQPTAAAEGLPDPLALVPRVLKETITGTRSVIHGDLNLENILAGPGSLVWLIDFAETREGHPLFDFAHLESELIAHVLAPRCGSPRAYLELWRAGDPLLDTLHALTARCLFDPARPREYQLALYLACLGALKYQNLPPLSKHCLYLTAADLAARL